MSDPRIARSQALQRDIELARFLCEQLRNDHPETLEVLFNDFHNFFRKLIARKVSDVALREEILQDFWCKLLDGNDLCGYEAQKGISLKSYLTRRLCLRIKDALRRETVFYRRLVNPDGTGDPEETENGLDRMLCGQGIYWVDPDITDTDLPERLFAKALDILSETRPQDAALIRDYLDGITYDQMAEQSGASDPDAIRRKSAALRQQFGRAKKRLAIILERLMEEY